jgi:hypothetical protein
MWRNMSPSVRDRYMRFGRADVTVRNDSNVTVADARLEGEFHDGKEGRGPWPKAKGTTLVSWLRTKLQR